MQEFLTQQSAAPAERLALPYIIHHVYAMQRSGHHAIMEWLMDCYAARDLAATHVNDVYHGHLDIVVDDPSAEEILAHSGEGSVLFVNYEDVVYADRFQSDAYRDLSPSRTGIRTQDIVVVRDWYNMAASRFQSILKAEASNKPLQLHAMSWPDVAKTWKQYAMQMLSSVMLGKGPLFISYNHWFLDSRYREAIAGLLGVPNSERHINNVPQFGDGSSFDGLAMDGIGRGMNVLHRWDNIAPQHRAAFLSLAGGDPAIDDLNRRIFNFGFAEVTRSSSEHLA